MTVGRCAWPPTLQGLGHYRVVGRFPPDVRDYIETRDAHESRRVWKRDVERGGDAEAVQAALDRLPEMDAIEAFAANAVAVNLHIGRRWYAMQEAREAGATREAIATALGITKQGAKDYYRRQIENQENPPGRGRRVDPVRNGPDVHAAFA